MTSVFDWGLFVPFFANFRAAALMSSTVSAQPPLKIRRIFMGGGTEGVEGAPALPPCCRLAPSFAQRGFTCLPELNLSPKTQLPPDACASGGILSLFSVLIASRCMHPAHMPRRSYVLRRIDALFGRETDVLILFAADAIARDLHAHEIKGRDLDECAACQLLLDDAAGQKGVAQPRL